MAGNNDNNYLENLKNSTEILKNIKEVVTNPILERIDNFEGHVYGKVKIYDQDFKDIKIELKKINDHKNMIKNNQNEIDENKKNIEKLNKKIDDHLTWHNIEQPKIAKQQGKKEIISKIIITISISINGLFFTILTLWATGILQQIIKLIQG